MTRVAIAGILLMMLITSFVIMMYYSASQNGDVFESKQNKATAADGQQLIENMVQHQPQQVMLKAESTGSQSARTPVIKPTLKRGKRNITVEAKAGERAEDLSKPTVDYMQSIETFRAVVKEAEAAVERLESINY